MATNDPNVIPGKCPICDTNCGGTCCRPPDMLYGVNSPQERSSEDEVLAEVQERRCPELTEARETIARMAEEVARLKAEIKELKNRPMECDPY